MPKSKPTIRRLWDRFWRPFAALIMIAISVGFCLPEIPSLKDLSGASGLQEPESTDSKIGNAEDVAKDWDKPEFVLFITGRQHGYIEPCGCITLERQKGGLMRRHRVMKILQQRGWDLVPIDAGNQIRRFGQQPLIKMEKTYEALCRVMGYDSIGIGPDDIKTAPEDFASALLNAPTNGKTPFTCANVNPYDQGFNQPYQVIEKNGKRIGVTMIIGDEHVPDANPDYNRKPMVPALADAAAKMKGERCDMQVLVAFTSPDNCRKLAQRFTQFDLVVTAGGAGDPTLAPEMIATSQGKKIPMIQVGVKGMYVGLVGMFNQGGVSKIQYKRVQLDHRYEDSEEIKEIFKSYQDELKDRWIRGQLEDIKPRPHPSGKSFVGAGKCADCHDEEFEIWQHGVDGKGGPHAEATMDLEQNPNDDRVWVQRQYDPECMSCHATGWNPQGFFPYASGLRDVTRDLHLHANGCENCHGPGSMHVALQEKADLQDLSLAQETLRKKEALAMRVTLKESRETACKECHDLDNSPDFLKEGGFDKYWPKIKHGRSASQKISDLLADVVDGIRPANEATQIQDWLEDLQDQNPDQVPVVVGGLDILKKNSNNRINVAREILKNIKR
ncbi:MAG: multiheme c-type cytochrome [Planctomycetota bacterium]